MRSRSVYFSVLPALCILICIIFSASFAAEVYLDVDLANVSIGITRGVEPTPFYLSYVNETDQYFASILTLNHRNGLQLGTPLRLAVPPDDYAPAAVFWSKHFKDNLTSGVEPAPFIVYKDYVIRYFRVNYDSDGTPLLIGDWETINLQIPPAMFGVATSVAELPGSEFDDGRPRLYIGTQGGFILILVYTDGVGVEIEGGFYYIEGPIKEMQPIPQYGYIALGALINGKIYGIDHRTTRDGEERYIYSFILTDPRGPIANDFDVIGGDDQQLSGPSYQTGLVLANGTNDLGIVSLYGITLGPVNMNIHIDNRFENISRIAAGSLLLIPADGSKILFDPVLTRTTGASGCAVDITDLTQDFCYGICGDVDNNGIVNILDIVYLIAYKYKSGPEPFLLNLGDTDGIDPVNILDIVYLINFKYKSGPSPKCP